MEKRDIPGCATEGGFIAIDVHLRNKSMDHDRSSMGAEHEGAYMVRI